MSEGQSLTPHPIQLLRIDVVEMNIGKNSEGKDNEITMDDFQMGLFPFKDEPQEEFKASIMLNIGHDNERPLPYKLQIVLTGYFKVDAEKFHLDNIAHWVEHNSKYILLPYVRAYASSLTMLAGFEPVYLPLTNIPGSLIKVIDKEQDDEAENLEEKSPE